MWTEGTQGNRYWIPDTFPESTIEYNNSQLLKVYKTRHGVRPNPDWKYDNGALVDDEYLFQNEGWKLIIDKPPIYDSMFEVLEKNDEQFWNIDEKTVEVSYNVRAKTEDELQHDKTKRWGEIKEIRNEKLKKLDHVLNIAYENNLVLTQKFKDYRQALRDIPETFDDPFSVVWTDELTQWEYYEP